MGRAGDATPLVADIPAPLAFVSHDFANRMSTGKPDCSGFAVRWLSMSPMFRSTPGCRSRRPSLRSRRLHGASLYGYTTKKDLSGFGTFLIMGVVGLLVAMVVNIFLQSTAMHFAISAIGVLLFAGLTAYDTQKIKSMYAYVAGTDMLGKSVIMGALTLYLDFINMFSFLLSFMGNRE